MKQQITITNSTGNPLNRNSAAAIRRVMLNPVNITAESPCDYAMVHHSVSGMALLRDGENTRSAKFTLYRDNEIISSGVYRDLMSMISGFLKGMRK